MDRPSPLPFIGVAEIRRCRAETERLILAFTERKVAVTTVVEQRKHPVAAVVDLVPDGEPVGPPRAKPLQLCVKFRERHDIYNPGDVATFDYDIAHALCCRGHARPIDSEPDESKARKGRGSLLQRVDVARPAPRTHDATPFRFHGLGDKLRAGAKP